MKRCGGIAWAAMAVALGSAIACSDTPADSPATDAAIAQPDATVLPPFAQPAPAAEAFGVRRGWIPSRGIIHMHSVYSHDACDGEPRQAGSGAINEPCLADLHAALCATRIDYVSLTDHDVSMADETFADLLGAGPGDELLPDAQQPIAARLACPNGQSVLVYIGAENAVMPIMLDRHPPVTGDARHQAYDAETRQAMEGFRELGGLAWVAHTESKDLALLRELQPDGIEVYNLHANLGINPSGLVEAIAALLEERADGPEPDLALLFFIARNDDAVGKWNALLGDGLRVSGSAGTDAHQNAFPVELSDGERADSYRRMLRWFSNVTLVADPNDYAATEAAVAAGRFFMAFELFGIPHGFDMVAGSAEIGDAIAAADLPTTLEVTLPEVYGLDPSLPAPEIRARVLRIEPGGAVVEIAEGVGPRLEVELTAGAVAYRTEVYITPHHLGPYLRAVGPALSEVEYTWIYSNPIYVTP